MAKTTKAKTKVKAKSKSNYIGKKCICRGYGSGVNFGIIKSISSDGRKVEIRNARKIYYWDGAATLLQIANSGVTNPGNCKITVSIQLLLQTDVIEIIPMTDISIKCMEGISAWKK